MLLDLQREWGADEAIGDNPVDRLAVPVRRTVPAPSHVIPASGVAARAAAIAAACVGMAELRAAAEAFDGCPLRDTAGHLVFADGPEDARLMVVVEAPGAEDDEAGRPLSGRPGNLFDAMIGSVGLPRRSVRIGCLVPWRPPGGRPATAIEIAACKPFLQAHLRLLQDVTHLVLLGATVARALSGAEGQIRQLRGRWLRVERDGPAVAALVMAPLEMIASDPRQKEAAWSDLIALRRALDTPPITSE